MTSFLTSLNFRAQREKWADGVHEQTALATLIARGIRETSGMKVSPGEAMTLSKARYLISLCENLEAVPLSDKPSLQEWLKRIGSEGYYLPPRPEEGIFLGTIYCNTKGNPKRRLQTHIHEFVHHIMHETGLSKKTSLLTGADIGQHRKYRYQNDEDEMLTWAVTSALLMPRSSFGPELARRNLFDLAYMFNVNLEPAAKRLLELSPVSLVALTESLKSARNANYYLYHRKPDAHLLEVTHHVRAGLITGNIKIEQLSIETVNVLGTNYMVACYLYPLKIEGIRRKRTIVFLTAEAHESKLGIFNSFPIVLKEKAWQ